MFATGFLFLTIAAQASEDSVYSGPQPGESLSSFQMSNGIGADVGRKITVAEQHDGVVTIVFVHELTRPAFGLSNAVMRLVSDRKTKMKGALVYLSEDPTQTLDKMKNSLSKYIPRGIDAGVFSGGVEGPEAYGLNRKVSVTVLVAKDKKVMANFALIQPSMEADAPKIFKAIGDVLGENESPKVADFVPSSRMQKKRTAPAGSKDAKPQDPQIRSLLAPLVRAETKKDVDAAAAKIESYVSEHPKTKVQIGNIARRIIAAEKLKNYGTAECQEYLTKWAKKFVAARDTVK